MVAGDITTTANKGGQAGTISSLFTLVVYGAGLLLDAPFPGLETAYYFSRLFHLFYIECVQITDFG